ncbi:MAG: PstS family phosphate ABC transporter substrate-binding protein [Nitrospinae bacterium]|nr:PstS family phosphate ABC transporter substrate-binding protein [Nitrospinota bacterium]
MSRLSRICGLAFAVAIGFVLVAQPAGAALMVDKKLPAYKATSGVSGNVKSVGSDTLNNLMTLWAEGFRRSYPDVKIEIEGKGSSTAPPALIAGTSNFGPMSRAMKSKEVDAFEKKFGYKPGRIRVAVDALAVFTNKDNPLKCLSLPQVDAIFSKTRKGGMRSDVATWGQLGLEGMWASKPISVYGRNSASGTYGYFKKVALYKGDYKDSVKEQPGSSAVVQGVASDKFAIGYSGIGYKTADVIALPVSKKTGAKCYGPEAKNAYSGNYPIARFLYIYVNKNPNQALDPLRAQFVKYIFSKGGQQAVIKAGFFPVNAAIAKQDLGGLGLGMGSN